MDYTMKAETGRIMGRGISLGGPSPEDRKWMCEAEIKAILEKYGCHMVVSVIPR